jgi:hypothetical protein
MKDKEIQPNEIWNEEKSRDIGNFNQGAESVQKETKKQIKDLKNKYGSWLSTEQGSKLGKIVNQEEVLKLKLGI